MAEIKLTRGMVAIVDDADVPLVAGYSWHAKQCKQTFYAEACPGHNMHILMHHLIVQLDDGQQCDHEDRNGLNNSRSNLRVATRSQNARNKRMSRNNTSGFKGVYFNKHKQRWQAQIVVNGKRRFLGRFATPEAGAVAYDVAAKRLHGEFAATNADLGYAPKTS